MPQFAGGYGIRPYNKHVIAGYNMRTVQEAGPYNFRVIITFCTVHELPVGASRQKNCPGYSQDSENSIIIGEAIASPQLFLYKRKIFVYNRKSCNAHIIKIFCRKRNSVI